MNEFTIILPAKIYGRETAREFVIKGDTINATISGVVEINLINGVTIAVFPATAVIIKEEYKVKTTL
jgi:hypothetical protein